MHLAIDAVNIRQGGGVTHLSQLLQVAEPFDFGFDKITIWCGAETAALLPNKPWLVKRCLPWMDARLPRRIIGHQFQFADELTLDNYDVLFCPGGIFPQVKGLTLLTMSQNMLPFEPGEAMKFGRFSLMRLKMGILRIMQTRSFLKADGIIFLSEYAKNKIQHNSDEITCSSALIPHGIESRFFQSPRYHRNIDKFSFQFPFRFLYVSILMPYKHQIEVAIAVAYLRGQGLPIEMYFIGGSWGNYGLKFQSLLRELDPEAIFLLYEGHVEFDDLHARYRGADAFVFASSCENLPNILIEAMASGLPIACSNRGPMPEILGSAGVYFDPESPSSIAEALLGLFKDDELRKSLALKAWHSAQKYSWELCAKDTLRFISKVAQFKGQRS